MSKRLETIKRLAETDDYWKGYLDGLNRTREADAVEWREYARLMQARLARAVDDVADRSEFRPVDEVRARLRARRNDRNTDTTDYDSEWRRASDARDAATPASPGVFAWSADASPIEEVRERLRARRLGLPYPTRLDVEAR